MTFHIFYTHVELSSRLVSGSGSSSKKLTTATRNIDDGQINQLSLNKLVFRMYITNLSSTLNLAMIVNTLKIYLTTSCTAEATSMLIHMFVVVVVFYP